MLPHAVQIADPFHVVKLANFVLDETRRRVQNETCGNRGRKSDPLYRIRKLMTIAHERLDDDNDAKLRGLLAAGDPAGEVRTAWHAKEVVREIYTIDDPETAAEFVAHLGIDLQDDSCPPEVQRLGRTIVRWRHQIAAWHRTRHTNGPTEAVNNLIKRIKRVAFRDHQLDELSHPHTALRRPTQLVTAQNSTLKSEAPSMPALMYWWSSWATTEGSPRVDCSPALRLSLSLAALAGLPSTSYECVFPEGLTDA